MWYFHINEHLAWLILPHLRQTANLKQDLIDTIMCNETNKDTITVLSAFLSALLHFS